MQQLILHLLQSAIAAGQVEFDVKSPNSTSNPSPPPEFDVKSDPIVRIANALDKLTETSAASQKKASTKDEINRRIALMLAWVEQTGETQQKRLAEEFGLHPSSLRGLAYECVRQAISLNKLANRRLRMTGNITNDHFVSEVLNE